MSDRWKGGAVLTLMLLGACKDPHGACVMTTEQGDMCYRDESESDCSDLSSAFKATTKKFVLPSDDDKSRYETVKGIVHDISSLTCERLGFTQCSQDGRCTRN